MAAIGTGVVDVSSVEKELNDKYANNPNIRINDIVILGYVTDYSYYPIEFNIVDGKITLVNNSILLNRRLFVCSNRQYLNETYTSANKDYTASSNIIELRSSMKTAWNKDKFLIFLNGFYIGRNHYHILIPSFDNEYLKKNVVSTNVDSYIGKTAIVIKTIEPRVNGLVNFENDTWTAVSNEIIAENSIVRVIAIEGNKLIVKRKEGDE